MPRTYEPCEQKHKWPKGFGTLCPIGMTAEETQRLLDQAVSVPGQSTRKLWAATGRWCFCAHPTREEEGVWHGFPVPGRKAGERVLAALEAAGLLSHEQRRALRNQRTLPPEWP